MKKLASIIMFIFACTALTGCATPNGTPENTAQSLPQNAPQSPETAEKPRTDVIIAISTEPQNGFDPTSGWGHGTAPLVQSTLVEYTQDMRIINDLATDYTISEDGKTWIFSMREDAFFTDGERVKPSDVVFTFETAKKSQSTLDLTYLTSAAATGENEVTFTLNAPNSSFINTIATLGIVPAHLYGENYANAPVGSGPWKLVQWNKGEQIILEANESYYGKVPAIKKATIVFMGEDAAFAAAMAGQVDVALTSATHATRNIDGMRIQAVSTLDNRGFTLPVSPAGSTTPDGFPMGNDVTANKAIRQALAYGIDREMLAKDALNGYGTPAFSENDGMPWNNPQTRIETDIEYAKKLLADDGWIDLDGNEILEKDGITAEFTCIYPGGDSVRQAVAMAAAQQAKKLGINIIVEGTSWDDIQKRMFTDAVMMGWGSTNPYTSYLLYHSANALRDDYYNPEGFKNETVDAYLDAALHANDQNAANENWQKAQWDGTTGTSMRGECPWVWLVNVSHIYYVADGLDIGEQKLHAHGASWTLVRNLKDWAYSER